MPEEKGIPLACVILHTAHNMQHILKGGVGLGGCPYGAAEGGYRIPVRTYTQPGLDSATCQHIQSCCLLCQYRWQAQRQVGDARADVNAFGYHCQRCQQRPRLAETRL